MNRKRVYRTFIHKEAVLRICCEPFAVVTQEIVRQRAILEDYIRRDPHFQHSLKPVSISADAPEVARRMARAARYGGRRTDGCRRRRHGAARRRGRS